MSENPVRNIKLAQKERILFREISKLFLQEAQNVHDLRNLSITRVNLSPDKSVCYVYFYTTEGKEVFDKNLHTLKLYKPSLRKALADSLQFRYTPEIIFKFDSSFEKQESINLLIEKLKGEGKL